MFALLTKPFLLQLLRHCPHLHLRKWFLIVSGYGDLNHLKCDEYLGQEHLDDQLNPEYYDDLDVYYVDEYPNEFLNLNLSEYHGLFHHVYHATGVNGSCDDHQNDPSDANANHEQEVVALLNSTPSLIFVVLHASSIILIALSTTIIPIGF